MKSGFKVLINGRVERCFRIEADYDEATVKINNGKPEDFERETFVVSTEQPPENDVMEKPGKRGGRTVAGPVHHTKKKT